MVKVESSNISSVDYNGTELIVEYKSGAKYKYKNVTEDVYNNFINAPSKGRFLNEAVKGKFEYERIL